MLWLIFCSLEEVLEIENAELYRLVIVSFLSVLLLEYCGLYVVTVQMIF